MDKQKLLDRALAKAALHFGVPVFPILYDRKERYVTPKRAVMAFLHYVLGMRVTDIGRLLYRDHSTVIYHLKIHDHRLSHDEDYARRYEAMTQDLMG